MQTYTGKDRRGEPSSLTQASPICGKISEFFHDTRHIHWEKIGEVADAINALETNEEARYILGYLEAFSKTHTSLIILFLEKIAPIIKNHLGKEIMALVAISDIKGKSEKERNTILNSLGFQLGESFQGIRNRFPRERTEVVALVGLVGRLTLITMERNVRAGSDLDGVDYHNKLAA